MMLVTRFVVIHCLSPSTVVPPQLVAFIFIILFATKGGGQAAVTMFSPPSPPLSSTATAEIDSMVASLFGAGQFDTCPAESFLYSCASSSKRQS